MKQNTRKVVLINPLLGYDHNFYEHVPLAYPYPGLMILSTILNENGFEVELIDANLFTKEKFMARINSAMNNDPVFIGFSLMTMNISWAYPVIQVIKGKKPDLKIVVGGVHPTLFPDDMIKDQHIDIVVINEATSTIVPLTEKLSAKKKLDNVPGIYFKEGSNIVKNIPNSIHDSFEKISFINFSLIDHHRYAKNNVLSAFDYFPVNKYIVYPIQTSLGCPFQCTFCINSLLKRKYKIRSAEEIVERIQFLQETYDANFIAIYDEDFFANKKRLFRFVELVEAKNLKFFWRASLRVNYFNDGYLNRSMLKRLENIGFLCAVMGGESSSKRVLDYLQKGTNPDQILRAIEDLSKTNIVPKMSFMVGIPGEMEKEVLDTYKFVTNLKKIAPVSDLHVLAFRLEPGSKLYDTAVEDFGYHVETDLKKIAKIKGSELQKGWGYPVGKKAWIKNQKRFDLMQFYYNTFIMPHTGNKGVVLDMFFKVAISRFNMNFFGFSFIEKWFYQLGRIIFLWTRSLSK